MGEEDGVLDHVQRLRAGSCYIGGGFIKLLWRSYAYEAQFDRKRGRNSLEFFSGPGVEWVVWIP
jgi:hypothetical protein